LLPLYSPFLPVKRVQEIRVAMGSSDNSTIHNKAGITPSSISSPDWLRFCPACVENDRRQFQECYWHRLHQVPGVEVCPVHNVFLSDSSARSRNRVNSSLYVSAESVMQPAVLRPFCRHEPDHQALLQIATDAEWLLNIGSSVPSFSSLHHRYQSLLAKSGYLTKDGKVSLKRVMPALRNKYSNGLLEAVQCDFDENKGFNWPSLIVKRITKSKTDPPIRHLLFIQLLGTTVEAFFCRPLKRILPEKTPKFASPQDQKPFGEGPWPCLNTVCKQYRKLKIKSCIVTSSQ